MSNDLWIYCPRVPRNSTLETNLAFQQDELLAKAISLAQTCGGGQVAPRPAVLPFHLWCAANEAQFDQAFHTHNHAPTLETET